MERYKLIRSMSKKGCSPDNAACEVFHRKIKNEFFYCENWNNVTIDKFIMRLNEYLLWYAKKRIKVSLGGLSPMEYRISKNLWTEKLASNF